MSADPENEYFSDGLTEELINVLARNPELKVTGRTSSFVFKGERKDLREIGRVLGVETILEGSVRKSGNRVRITTQLIKVKDGFHIWTETYDRVLEDVFAVQDEIAGSVGSALNVTLLGQPMQRRTPSSAAYQLILQGRHLCSQNSSASLTEAKRLFEQAIELEPDSAKAWSGLANVYFNLSGYGYGNIGEGSSRARKAAMKAVELDAQSVYGQLELAWSEFRMPRRWDAARKAFDRARELAPGDSRTIYPQAVWTAAVDHPRNAIPTMQQAIEIDPLNARHHYHLGKFHWWCDQFDLAIESLKTCLSLSPNFTSGHARLSLMYVSKGALDDALTEAQAEPVPGYRAYALAIVYHAMGRAQDFDDAVSTINSPGSIWSCQMAVICGYRNELDAAFDWLDRARTTRDTGLPWLRPHIFLRSLHGDPRWPAFLKQIGLTP